jgi:hypothetical protein
MLVTMKTSWRRHRSHAMANLAFRATSALGFAAGVLVVLTSRAAAAPTCDVQEGACLARLVRYEALVHAAPPVAGLVLGMLLGTWLSRAVLTHARAKT